MTKDEIELGQKLFILFSFALLPILAVGIKAMKIMDPYTFKQCVFGIGVIICSFLLVGYYLFSGILVSGKKSEDTKSYLKLSPPFIIGCAALVGYVILGYYDQ